MKTLKSFLQPRFLLPALLILALYFFIRTINLTKIPVFVDEAIYIRWAQIMKNEPTLRFLPLSDGKQPLFMWLVMPALKFFADPLVAGRMVSAISGFATLIGLSSLAYFLTRSRLVVLFAALLYTIVPYTLFFDRMALVDSLLSAFAVWSLFLGLLLVRTPRLDLAMILGFILGGAWLTKSPGLFFLLLQPVLLLAAAGLNRKKLLKILGGWLVAGSIALAMYNILRLGPNFNLVFSRNQDYVFSLAEVLSHPLNPLIGNLERTISWLGLLFTWPLLLVTILAFLLQPRRSIIAVFLFAFLPLLAQAAVAKVYTTRYLLYSIPLLLLLASLTLRRFPLLLLILIFPVFGSFKLLTNPEAGPLPQVDKHGYFQEWTAGYGQKEVAAYLIDRAKDRTIVVGTEGIFGTLPDGLQIYTQKQPNINVFGIGQPVVGIPGSLSGSLALHEVYLVVNQSRNYLKPDMLTRLELIAEYPKPPRPDGSREVLQFYRLLR